MSARQPNPPESVRRVAGVVLASGGLLALLALLRFVYQGAIGERHFLTSADVALYYVVPAVAAATLFASLRLTAVDRVRVFVSTLAFAAALYGIEAFLVLFSGASLGARSLAEGQLKPVMTTLAQSPNPVQYGAELTARFGRPIDPRKPSQVLAALRAQGFDVERIITASNQLFIAQPDGRVESAIRIDGREVVPLGGVSNQRTLLCNESGQWVDFESDRHGFENPDQVWQSARAEIAVLGDSFAQGYCVPSGHTFVDLIRARRYATVNLALSGDGPLLELATLEEFLPRLRPRIVLWFYYEGNDLTDLQTERKSRLLTQYLKPGFSQPDLARQADLDAAMLAEVPRLMAAEAADLRDKRWDGVASGLASFAKLTAVRDRLSPIVVTNSDARAAAADLATTNAEVFRQIMAQATARVAAWGGTLYFVYLPEWSRYTKYESWGIKERDDVLRMVRSLAIPVIDLDPAFRATGDPLALFPFREVGHYTEAGHRLVAQEVLRRLPSHEAFN